MIIIDYLHPAFFNFSFIIETVSDVDVIYQSGKNAWTTALKDAWANKNPKCNENLYLTPSWKSEFDSVENPALQKAETEWKMLLNLGDCAQYYI